MENKSVENVNATESKGSYFKFETGTSDATNASNNGLFRFVVESVKDLVSKFLDIELERAKNAGNDTIKNLVLRQEKLEAENKALVEVARDSITELKELKQQLKEVKMIGK